MSTIDRMKIMVLIIIELNKYLFIYIIRNKSTIINIINFKNNVLQVFGSNL